MPIIAKNVYEAIHSPESSAIRKMFEEGILLKKKHGECAVFDFTLGNPCLKPPAEVLNAISALATDRELSHGYMPNAGFEKTRAVIAQKIEHEQAHTLDFNSIVMTSGAAGALNCVLKIFMEDSETGKTQVLAPSPFFAEYAHYAKNHGGELKPVPTAPDFSLDIAAIENAISEKTACIIINSPNNPTGKIYSQSQIKELTAMLKAKFPDSVQVPALICDEPYREIVYDGKSVPPVFPFYDNTIIVSSFAKNLSLAGERVGYIAVHPKFENFQDTMSALIFANRTLGYVNANAFFQRVIERSALQAKPDFSHYERCRKLIMHILDKAHIEYAVPEGAFYVFCKVPAPKRLEHTATDGAFCAHLKKHLVLCAPGSGFGKSGMFRIAYCVEERVIKDCESAFLSAVDSW